MLTKEERYKFYKAKAWSQVRLKVLSRDNYECQQCKHEGLTYTNKHDTDKHKRLDVDHIKDLEHYPELGLEIDNLITLCVRHHNQKHNRFTKKIPKWTDERW